MACMVKIMTKPCNEGVLSLFGYSMPGPVPATEEQILFEDMMSESFVKYCMALVGQRTRRELWMFSAPSLAVQFDFEQEDVTTATLQELQHDYYDHLPLQDARANGEAGEHL